MKKVVYSPAFLIIWIVITGAISFSLIRSMIDIRGADARALELEKRNQEIQRRIDGLKIQIAIAETPFAKERIIREELGLQLPGETIVQIKRIEGVEQFSHETSSLPTAEKSAVEDENAPIYRRWLRLFFDR